MRVGIDITAAARTVNELETVACGLGDAKRELQGVNALLPLPVAARLLMEQQRLAGALAARAHELRADGGHIAKRALSFIEADGGSADDAAVAALVRAYGRAEAQRPNAVEGAFGWLAGQIPDPFTAIDMMIFSAFIKTSIPVHVTKVGRNPFAIGKEIVRSLSLGQMTKDGSVVRFARMMEDGLFNKAFLKYGGGAMNAVTGTLSAVDAYNQTPAKTNVSRYLITAIHGVGVGGGGAAGLPGRLDAVLGSPVAKTVASGYEGLVLSVEALVTWDDTAVTEWSFQMLNGDRGIAPQAVAKTGDMIAAGLWNTGQAIDGAISKVKIPRWFD